jgi:S1-C subfamily serine protease
MGDSSLLDVGDVVLAIGSPLSLKHSVSMGIVSGLSRNNLGVLLYEDYIQTDANLNHGNSGGALVNLDAEVIGINTLNAGPGLSFAISINYAKRVLDDLLSYGAVSRGWLGILMLDLDAHIRSHFGYAGAGVLIQSVYAGSPAEKAGLKPGDIIVAVNNKHIQNSNDLRHITAIADQGTSLEVSVWRQQQQKQIAVTIEKRPIND